jgi:RHS repeat-associated protein
LVGWIILLLTLIAPQSPATTVTKSISTHGVRDYLNPNTGRFWSMDSFEGSSSDPHSLHKYLYVHCDPVDGSDPSGHKAAFGRADAAAIGKEVHKRIGQDFVSGHEGERFTGSSVHTIMKLPNPVNMLFPDLVDKKYKQVYEIKPMSIAGTATGIIQLFAYIELFNNLDPSGGWGFAYAAKHYNSCKIFGIASPLAVVTVFPPLCGMIYYKAETVNLFVGNRAMNVMQAQTAQIQQSMGISTMLGVLGGF